MLLGIPSSLGNGIWGNITLLGFNFLDFFDFISNSVIMPIVALLTCIFIGYIIKPKTIIKEIEANGKEEKKTSGAIYAIRKNFFPVMIKFVAPVCIVLILVSSVLSAFKIIEI